MPAGRKVIEMLPLAVVFSVPNQQLQGACLLTWDEHRPKRVKVAQRCHSRLLVNGLGLQSEQSLVDLGKATVANPQQFLEMGPAVQFWGFLRSGQTSQIGLI